jgi:L-seryl-tRNA(Ser) seleniumtransferase
MSTVTQRLDRFGNRFADGLPYAPGAILASTEDHYAKLAHARRIVERRHGDGSLFDFTGLQRSFDPGPVDRATLDDEIGPALYGERLTRLALEHLGGDPERDDVLVTNRLTAAIFVALQVVVRPGSTVIGVSPSYSHPAVTRAVAAVRARFTDTVGYDEFAERLAAAEDVSAVVLTRLAVTYELLPSDDLAAIVSAAHERAVPVFVDDAGGARVGPALLGQPKTLALGVDAGATGLDKYGTLGPRLGLLAGRKELVERMRARALELGVEARPMLYPAVVRSLEVYSEERVRELVAETKEVGDALDAALGDWVTRTPVAVRLEGEDVLAEALRRAALDEPPAVVPIEATAAVAMLLLRDHGILTVHFAALPPGTAALLIKFVPPETLARFGGAKRFAGAVDESLDRLADLVGDRAALRELLLGRH